MYNLRTGGDDAELCFWQEEGKELIRERAAQCGEYQKLKLVDSILGPANVWYLTNTRVLHSTENVKGLRLNLQISFDTAVPESIL